MRENPGMWLALGLGAYFLAQTAVRLSVGPGVQLDEAELLVMARDFRWGYGPQEPLYNWLQAGVFSLLGVNVAALVVTKNLCLWLFYMLAFLGLRRFCDARRSAVAVLGLMFVPTIVWEAQRTLSHSVALMGASAAFLWAACGLLRRDSWRGWLLLGLTVGLGGLSKTNFWLLPPALALALWSLPPAPGRLTGQGPGVLRGGLAAMLVAGAILIGPLAWDLGHPDLALMSVGKLYRGEGPILGGRYFGGLFEVIEAVVLSFVLLGPVVLGARWFARRGAMQAAPAGAVWMRRLLLRCLIIGLGLLALAMTLAGAARVSPRWLLPLAVPGATGLALWALEAGAARAGRVIGVAAVVVGVTVLIGIAVVFGTRPSRLSDDYTALYHRLQDLSAETATPVHGAMRDLGALLAVGPDLPVAVEPPLGPAYAPGRPLLRVAPGRGDDTPPAEGARLRGREILPVPNRIDPDRAQDFSVEIWDLP